MPPLGHRATKPAREPDAAALLAGEAEAAGLDVTTDAQGRYRIVGNAAALARIRWRDPALAAARLEIVVGPAGRKPLHPVAGEAATYARASSTTAEPVPVADRDSYAPGPKARALLRGRAIADADLRAADGTFSLREVMELLRISRQAVDKKVKQDALLAVPGPGNERRYPSCQFHRGGVVPGLRAVLQALPSRDPWFRLNFLVNPAPNLGEQRPCDLLQAGGAEAVIAAAERVAEMGA